MDYLKDWRVFCDLEIFSDSLDTSSHIFFAKPMLKIEKSSIPEDHEKYMIFEKHYLK